jgi:hypothetical protein
MSGISPPRMSSITAWTPVELGSSPRRGPAVDVGQCAAGVAQTPSAATFDGTHRPVRPCRLPSRQHLTTLSRDGATDAIVRSARRRIPPLSASRRYRTRGRACRTGWNRTLTESLPARAGDAAPDDHASAYLCAGSIESFAPGRNSSCPRGHGRRVDDRVGRRCALRRDGSRSIHVESHQLQRWTCTRREPLSASPCRKPSRSSRRRPAAAPLTRSQPSPSSSWRRRRVHRAGFLHDGSEGRRLSAEETHLARGLGDERNQIVEHQDERIVQRSTGRRPVPLADGLPDARVRGSAVRTGSGT